jgi:NAD(P)H-quinone oxidoreductase subunit 6
MAIVDLFAVFCFLLGAVSAVLVAFHPNILYAAVALIFSLLSVAGLYGVLGADFLAAVQLIIYVGGIIVVILFAVMMSENVYQKKSVLPLKAFAFPFVLSAVILFALLKVLNSFQFNVVESISRENTVELIGKALVGPYALVFQYVAIVLLAGLIGAVVVARPQYGNKTIRGEGGSQ